VEPLEGPTQIVVVSTTPVPGSENLGPEQFVSTISALQLTGTALSGATPVVLVATATPEGGEFEVPQAPTIATINPSLLPPVPSDLPPGLPSPTLAVENDGCIRHTIQSGDLISTLAQQYGVLPGDILLANGMDEQDAFNLQIGDVLIIPVEGCGIFNTPEPSPTTTNTPFEINVVAPTVTLAPTAANAQIVITNVISWGDVNNEAVELRNQGSVVNLQGWTLSNSRGDTFLFPEFRMQQGSLVRVLTRQGATTPAALYWGRDTAAWREGDTITLADSTGQAQATIRVGETP
jgi:LysM repeat protein